MKPKQRFYLGLAILLIGVAWMLTMMYKMEWYVEYIPNIYIMAICISISISMAIGGFIMIFSYFEDR